MDKNDRVIDINLDRLKNLRFRGRNVAAVVVVILLLILTFNFVYQIQPEEVGVVLRFGRYVRTTEPGLRFKLPFMETVQKVPVQRQLKHEFGFRTLEAGVSTRYSPLSFLGESLMMTGDLNVAVVEWIVQYRVAEPDKYLFKVRNVEDTIRDMTDGRGADAAIEAVGLPGAWETAVKLVRKGGTVNFFGGCPHDSRVALDTSLLHYSEITCKASFHHTPAHIQKALQCVSRGEITARDFVNGVEPLVNLLEVMRHLMSHNGHMKTAIIP